MPWLVATIYDRFMRASEEACLAAWRRELLGDLAGRILEVGAGTGVNLAHYGADARLVLAEPDAHMRSRLAARVAATGRAAEIVDASVEALPWADQTFDAVVSTLVLCSVPDPAAALSEIHRVLRPGGALVFVEHVAAEENPARLRWQRWVEPLWRRVAGNCHLTRRTADLIVDAGFALEGMRRESIRKAMPITRPSVRGLARKAAPAVRG
jgi:ubiquinone/menaquinone biosynthesis C-methylase UbiE